MKRLRAALVASACFIFLILHIKLAVPAENLQIKDRYLYYKSKPFFIKGIAYSPAYPKIAKFEDIPISVLEDDFKKMKEAGVNTIRTYRPLSPKLLDLVDKYGIMVIQTVAWPDDETDYNSKEELERLKSQAIEIVKRDKDRPCILMWSLWNDAPFQFGIKGGNVIPRYSFNQVNTFLKEIYLAVKSVDDKHPITTSNVLNSISYQLGFDFLDVIGINIYIGISDWFDGNFDLELAEQAIKRLQRISLDYNKPVFISEAGYSSFCKGYSQAKALDAQIKLAYKYTAGIIIFQWADEWDKAGNPDALDAHIEEHWGILDGYRNPKEGFYVISKIFNKISKSGVILDKIEAPEKEKSDPQLNKKGMLLEGFEYPIEQTMFSDLSKNWSGGINKDINLSSEHRHSGNSSLRIVFQPITTSGWLHFQTHFNRWKDLSKYSKIRFWVKGKGPIVNLSVMLIDKDKERWKTTAVFPIGDWQCYAFNLSELIRDPHDAEHDGVEKGDGKLNLKEIKSIAIEVTVVPNFEEIGTETVCYIDDIEVM